VVAARGGGGYNWRVPDASIGAVIAGHRIERLVGRGGMGVVYAAVDLALERTVALKLIAPELAAEPGFRQRFMTESRIAASLDHPNVVPIYRAGEEDGTLFLAMRLIDGDDLRTIVERDGPLAPERAAAVIAQVAAALAAAHARGLVHRDIKPANVLVTAEGHCYLTDFGLVKDLAATTGATRTGEVLGTLDYVAPERIRGGATGPATDVYALGCVLFFTLTGRVVFPLDAPERKLWAHVSEPAPPVSAVRPELGAAFDAVVARALAKDPLERYESAPALAAAALDAAGPVRRAASAGTDGRLGALMQAAGALRETLPGSPEADRFEAAADGMAARAQRLREAVGAHSVEQIERRIAEVRAGHQPGKAQLVDALAQQLSTARRMRARLEALDARLEHLVAELDALRDRAVAGTAPPAGELAALCDEIDEAARRIDDPPRSKAAAP
jgi:Protein kinase domain